jgi:hypothetical protein
MAEGGLENSIGPAGQRGRRKVSQQDTANETESTQVFGGSSSPKFTWLLGLRHRAQRIHDACPTNDVGYPARPAWPDVAAHRDRMAMFPIEQVQHVQCLM